MPLSAIVFLLLQVSLGSLLLIFLDPGKKLNRAELLFGSVVVGVASSSFLLLLLLLVSRSWSAALPIIWISLVVAGIFIVWKKLVNNSELLSNVDLRFISSATSACLLILLCLYSMIVFGVFITNEQGFPAAISKGWGDVAYHLNMIGRLKTADPFLLEQPIAAGERLTYPFIVNLLSALYEKIGFSKTISWHLPVLLFGISFFFYIFLLGKRLLREDKFALALLLLVFFGGGVGFLWFFQDLWIAWNNGGISAVFSTLTDPPHEYTHLDNRTAGKPYEAFHNIVWIVPMISFLSHQRSFVMGTSVATVIFLGFLLYRGNPNLWRWGILWGMIPFLHTHTFVAVSIILAFWFFHDVKNWFSWVKGGILGGVLALPQVIWLMPKELGSENSSFFKPWFGWMTCTHRSSWYACDPGVQGVDSSALLFWTKNFGFVFWVWVIAIFAFFILRSKRQDYYSKVKPFLLPSLVLFILPNVLLFQPWEFDNNKVLYYWWILASIISMLLFQTFFNRQIVSFIFITFIALSMYSGMIDVLARVSNFKENHHGYYGQKEVEVAEWIRENTESNARFLTGDSPSQFIPMLTGRPIYLGFTGWLWTQGKNELIQQHRERAQSLLGSGEASSVCEDGLDYVFWNGDLLRTYPGADRESLLSAADVVFSYDMGWEKVEIFKLKCPE